MAAARPPWTTRSATFSPVGPAPMTTTSYLRSRMSVPLRRAAETDGRDEEEDGAGNGVADRVGQRRVAYAGVGDEQDAGQHGNGAADDHRPLAAHRAAGESHGQLYRAGRDRPRAPHAQDRRDAGGAR